MSNASPPNPTPEVTAPKNCHADSHMGLQKFPVGGISAFLIRGLETNTSFWQRKTEQVRSLRDSLNCISNSLSSLKNWGISSADLWGEGLGPKVWG